MQYRQSIMLYTQLFSSYYMNWLNFIDKLKSICSSKGGIESETVSEDLQKIQEDSDNGPTR